MEAISPGFPAYWPTMQTLDLPASIVGWANSLKNVFIHTYTSYCLWVVQVQRPFATQFPLARAGHLFYSSLQLIVLYNVELKTSNLLYSKFTDLKVTLIQKHPHRNTQNHMWPHIREPWISLLITCLLSDCPLDCKLKEIKDHDDHVCFVHCFKFSTYPSPCHILGSW